MHIAWERGIDHYVSRLCYGKLV